MPDRISIRLQKLKNLKIDAWGYNEIFTLISIYRDSIEKEKKQ